MLVGRPGIGKGMVIKQVSPILKYWKVGQIPDIDPTDKEKTNETLAEMAALREQLKQTLEELNSGSQGYTQGQGGQRPTNKEERLVIPVAADAITYEALCKAMAKSVRSINYRKFCTISQKEIQKPYIHSSLTFCLEEVGSLFRKKTEDIVNFLLQAYDCGDYTYETKTQGHDYIKRCCLNFLGGTTPDFMQQVFNDALLNQGFSSRTFFIFSANNRFHRLNMAEYSEEQVRCRQDLLEHVRRLTLLHGQCYLSDDANTYLKQWWEVEQMNNLSTWRANLSNKLDAYYARKQLHVMKMCMIMHFAECHIDPLKPHETNMIISLATVQKAMKILADAEETMHYALNLTAANPLAPVARKILTTITQSGNDGTNFKALLIEYWDELPGAAEVDLAEVLKFLIASNKIVEEDFRQLDGRITKCYKAVKYAVIPNK